MEKKSVYAKGLYFNQNHPNTPDSVKEWKKGSVAVHIDNFITQLQSLKSEADQAGYIRFDLTKNKKGEEVFYSFRLNDYKPEKKEDTAEPIDDSGIPF